MKKYDFLPSRPPFLQDFCKKAQWRAKKLRERGSNTARPTEKGGGGLPIGARPVDFGASIRSRLVDFVAICGLPLGVSVDSVASRRFGASIRSISVASIRSRPVDLECCLCRDSVDSVDFGASIRSISVDSVASCRFGRVASKSRRKHKKSPIPRSGNRAQLSQGVARS